MKSVIAKSLLVVVIIFGISNYMLYLKTGKSPSTMLPKTDWSLSLPNKESVQNIVSDRLESEGGKEKVYKWTDSTGKVHYSTTPPLEKAQAKEISINPSANVVRRVEVPEVVEAEVDSNVEVLSQEQTASPSLSQAYDVDAVRRLIYDAKGVQTLMDERTMKLDQATRDSL